MRPLLLTVALVGVALFLVGLQLNLSWLCLLSKPLPMLALLVWLREAPAGAYRRWITIGLWLSLLGDMLLQWPTDLFVFGLGAFLLAHLAYLLAYLGDTRRLAPLDLLIAALAAGGMFFILARADLGPLLLPVALYSLAIGAMLWRALARIGVMPPRRVARLHLPCTWYRPGKPRWHPKTAENRIRPGHDGVTASGTWASPRWATVLQPQRRGPARA